MAWLFKPSFKKKFGQIQGGWSPSQVLELLGGPMEMEDSEIPLGSDWGNQPGMAFQMKAGDAIQQWMFEDKGEYYYLWFAKVNPTDEEPWRVTLTKKTPHRIAA
jgi:hypothetical protein